jgi:serine/threonine kinase 16
VLCCAVQRIPEIQLLDSRMNRRTGNSPLPSPRRLPTPLATIASAMQFFFSFLVQWYKWLLSYVRALFESWTGPILTLDSGRQVRIGPPIAEGGFSIVFRATPVTTSTSSASSSSTSTYALKRIRCEDAETVQQCRAEAAVHYAVGANHPNVMPLLGMAMDDQYCYMLFPFLPHSLRDEVNGRIFSDQQQSFSAKSSASHSSMSSSQPPIRSPFPTKLSKSSSSSHHHHHPSDLDALPPWNELQTLQIFRGILDGVNALHRANFSHRDIKLENILFRGSNNLTTPVIMDFGSVGPLTSPPLTSRRTVLQIADIASTHTTLPYRPPELFEGGIRVMGGDNNDANANVLDYTKVDVWMLGCTLFAMHYGASPFECEFHRSNGKIKIVDCTQLRVLGAIPYPPSNTAPSQWYSTDLKDLIGWMLTQHREQRPTLLQVMARVDALLQQQQQGTTTTNSNNNNNNNGTSLMEESDPIDVLMIRNVV